MPGSGEPGGWGNSLLSGCIGHSVTEAHGIEKKAGWRRPRDGKNWDQVVLQHLKSFLTSLSFPLILKLFSHEGHCTYPTGIVLWIERNITISSRPTSRAGS